MIVLSVGYLCLIFLRSFWIHILFLSNDWPTDFVVVRVLDSLYSSEEEKNYAKMQKLIQIVIQMGREKKGSFFLLQPFRREIWVCVFVW